ncbi:unknown [Prevotella sp. CAG:1185]|nr:unknown [Prevotella sp. CAG:1185]
MIFYIVRFVQQTNILPMWISFRQLYSIYKIDDNKETI